ncbi:tetratricopeptide repeat protein [Archangium violaceum]|uniref:tetratricopeptide repeat protein n=1 Tax=Archangium violaceum TaxID=83451 RepID=UPI00194E10AC|nr:tetratricopeptide repeat protein [Archangium violaceum]QRN93908.1 tetratricopeptide repeat protein [Archangium violaceum]
MSSTLPKHKAVKLYERARTLLAREEFSEAEKILRDLAAHDSLGRPEVPAALGDVHLGRGEYDAAASAYREGLSRFPGNRDLTARVGLVLIRQDRFEEAVALMGQLELKGLGPDLLTQYGYALARLERYAASERIFARAVAGGAGPEARMLLARVRAKLGRYEEAANMCRSLREGDVPAEVQSEAKGLLADCLLMQGQAAPALGLWKEQRAAGELQPEQLGHMAYAAQLAGEPGLCDQLITERLGSVPTAEDRLLFAQIANLRNRPEDALEHLAVAEAATGEHYKGFIFELEATRGRALRLLGRRQEAREALARASGHAESQGKLGPQLQVDLGHLSAEEGDFESAEKSFQAALEMDPDEPEARRGLELTRRREAWRTQLQANVEAQVEAAKAESDALRRRFVARESELEALRRELETLRAAQAQAEEKARRAEEEARAAQASARAEQARRTREELEQRETEIDAKARENVERGLGKALATCPPPLLQAMMVAERTYQKALYTDLPAAAVAVLFAGALERALYTLFVERFRQWLDARGQLKDFLQAATREKRGRKVEYFDNFAAAFDPERPGRPPSMGEVARVLQRREEPYLHLFLAFLTERYPLPGRLLDVLADFVIQAKERLRDPVAHGRAVEMGYEELKVLRERLLFALEPGQPGALALLLGV